MKVISLIFVAAFAQLILLASSWGGGAECNQELIQFLEIENGNAKLTEAAVQFLNASERAGMKVIPIAVPGNSRSGKSFFLNTLTKCPNKFAVGHEMTSKTKGVVAFPLTYKDSNTGEEYVVLLLDTEGLGKKENNDKVVLLFSVLAASHVVYHLEGKIQSSDISRLDEVTRLYQALEAKHISTRYEFPKVTWVIEKVTLNEGEISKHQEEALSVNDNCRTVQEKVLRTATVNRIKDTEFAGHPPYYLHGAVNEVDQWVKLDQISRDKLDPDFLSNMDKIEEELKKSTCKKLIKTSDALTCNEYAEFLKIIMDIINTQSAVYDLHGLIKFIVDRAVGEGQQVYDSCMSKLKLPVEEFEWSKKDLLCKDEAFEMFNAKTLTENVDNWNERGRESLKNLLSSRHDVFWAKYEEESRINFDNVIEECNEELNGLSHLKNDPVFDEQVKNIIVAINHRFVGPDAMVAEYKARVERTRAKALENRTLPKDEQCPTSQTPWDFLKKHETLLTSAFTFIVGIVVCYIVLFVLNGKNQVKKKSSVKPAGYTK